MAKAFPLRRSLPAPEVTLLNPLSGARARRSICARPFQRNDFLRPVIILMHQSALNHGTQLDLQRPVGHATCEIGLGLQFYIFRTVNRPNDSAVSDRIRNP